MLTNFHTHTTFCDGKNSAEEMVCAAIEKGFSVIGFSGHGYTDFDLSYCIKDMELYRREILSLKEKYADKIEVYLGIEEDMLHPLDRTAFEYILGSCHYVKKDERYYPLDLSREGLLTAIEAFDNNTHAFAEHYYQQFCEYIVERKPDIIGHFDLITKFDECGDPLFLNDETYYSIAAHYLRIAATAGCLFEVNTGAISRGYRTAPYPHEALLHLLHKLGGRVILSSDCHHIDGLDCYFDEARLLLKDCGFRHIYTMKNRAFIEVDI